MPAGENAEAEIRQKVIVELSTQAPMSVLWCERNKQIALEVCALPESIETHFA